MNWVSLGQGSLMFWMGNECSGCAATWGEQTGRVVVSHRIEDAEVLQYFIGRFASFIMRREDAADGERDSNETSYRDEILFKKPRECNV